jgi:hypothetical protein
MARVHRVAQNSLATGLEMKASHGVIIVLFYFIHIYVLMSIDVILVFKFSTSDVQID